ncbi:MAG: 16S rRNA (cytosine(1402)-N(4))-methyltransferase RsmH [Planctomycetes bacterium]|nr:16S rRNA (cytosine(1402)-N(4))-methyltransferase RsmH [Planctomycetota bacterium]
MHIPVMPDEVLHYLDPQPRQLIVDATVGGGGHSRLIAEIIGEKGRLIGLDLDPEMLALARPRLVGMNATLVHRSFDELSEVLRSLRIEAVDGILADLGFCSDQLADPNRGLSFQQDGPLDMRLDQTRGEPASSLLRRLQERELADIFWRYGEERYSRRIAARIMDVRRKATLETTEQLATLVRTCVPRSRGHAIDPATRVFQALRIAVNDELGALERFLAVAPDLLTPGGRLVVISFQSLEDRLVKRALRNKEIWEELTRKPVTAQDEEIRNNPRARSAKLRAATKKEIP